MKIIVNNEEEKKVVDRFIEYLRECGIDQMESEDRQWSKENGGEQMVESQEWTLLRDTFHYGVNVIIDSNEPEMYFDDDDIIVGTCIQCGKETSGTIDGDSVSYSQYLEMTSEKSQKSWRCDTCWRNGINEEIDSGLMNPVYFTVKPSSPLRLLTIDPEFGDMTNEAMIKVSQQIDELLHQWTKALVQHKFDAQTVDNKTELARAMREAGYTMTRINFDEYVMFHNGEEISRTKLPIVFSN